MFLLVINFQGGACNICPKFSKLHIYICLLNGTLLGAPLEIVKVQAIPLHSLIDQDGIQFCIDPCVFKFFFLF